MTTTASDIYRRLPEELQNVPQWCIAGPEKAPYVATKTGVHNASIYRTDQWKKFSDVLTDVANTGAPGLGFVLTTNDPWTCIDLDVCNAETQRIKGQPIDATLWTTTETMERFSAIVKAFDSYTEVSTMGWGLHIWVRGRIGLGVKRDGIEVYSQERFIVCTGNVYVDRPIADRQEMLENMVSQMRGPGYRGAEPLVEIEQEETDMEIFERASSAQNSDKFNRLCAGDWKDEYPSQSEADLSLLSMLCFYSKSNEQVRRLFRCTALGQREKATKNNRYIDFTLEVIRSRQAREEVHLAVGEEQAKALIARMQTSDYSDVAAGQIATSQIPRADVASTVDWPPGLAGAIAAFIYNSAPRPVKEVAIVAALGFLAGVCGKAFNIPQSGLNMYIILVARSGVGKEAMHSGLSLILEELMQSIPAAQKFVNFNDFASGPALVKECAQNSSFVNVAGEWGRKLKRIAAEERADGVMAGLRTVMTNLYQKSGAGNISGGITYSNKDQNISSLTGVSYSMIGETTPSAFYEALTPSMMEDGFLSRFIILDYAGDRPPLNSSPQRKMNPALAQALHGLCAQSLTLITRFATEKVNYSQEASVALDEFNLTCDININATEDESVRQMWNRAHLKVLRVAALLAAADNWIAPVVSLEHAQWALDLIQRDIKLMSHRMDSGDVGLDDHTREKKMLHVIRGYVAEGAKSPAYKVPDGLHEVGIIPHRYISMRLSRSAPFLNTREGATKQINTTLNSLVSNGYLTEMDAKYMMDKHVYHGRAYRVVSLPD